MLRLLVSAIALSCTLAVPVASAEPRPDDYRAGQRGHDVTRHRAEDRRGSNDHIDPNPRGRDENDRRDRDDQDRRGPDRDSRQHARDRGDNDRGWDGRDSDRHDWVRHDYRTQPRYIHRNIVVVRDYYAGWRPYPPGHARRWQVGYPLPREVVYSELPPELLVRLEPMPYGHRYVRVDNDILTIVIATGLIVDILEDFGRG